MDVIGNNNKKDVQRILWGKFMNKKRANKQS
jgi:hypothetical protein